MVITRRNILTFIEINCMGGSVVTEDDLVRHLGLKEAKLRNKLTNRLKLLVEQGVLKSKMCEAREIMGFVT